LTLRQLAREDATAFQRLRLHGLGSHPLAFRSSLDEESWLSIDEVGRRLAAGFVVGAFTAEGELAGIGGLARFEGTKVRHKAVLWGMFVREDARGHGLARAIVERLLEYARSEGIEAVLLSVDSANDSAKRLYEHCGFVAYGVEPRAMKIGDGTAARYGDDILMIIQLTHGDH
jgi:GNAT superfamily N-acetyltransferase